MTKKHKRIIRFTARCLLLTFSYQILFPNVSLALTSGPSQPEVQNFEPVGTTDMVDMFTGDFSYNIPLLDIEGYPVNIAYHAGVGMEQEASWVGLGWNINPGVINRTVRGIPDDFKGETLSKELNIEPEKTLRVGTEIGGEAIGVGDPLLNLSASVQANVTFSNYRGASVDFGFSSGVNLFRTVSAGVNFGVGSQTGADIDFYSGVNVGLSNILSKDIAAGVGVNFGTGYNTRSGLKDQSFSVSTNIRAYGASGSGPGGTVNIPIGIRNYVPVITNSSTMKSYYGRIKAGAEFAWCNAWGAIKGMGSVLKYNNDGSRKSYGYLYAEEALPDDIHDFTRDKDGLYNKSMGYLPPGNMTYDIYSVTGQGTGGSFRPFRNDIGAVYDPATRSTGNAYSGQVEGSIGWLFAVGIDFSMANTEITSGPWHGFTIPFRAEKTDTATALYENTYFKQGGEFTVVDDYKLDGLLGTKPIGLSDIKSLAKHNFYEKARPPRANMIHCIKAADAAANYGVATEQKIKSYESTNGFADSVEGNIIEINRTGDHRKGHHISEIVQYQTDGRRYVYGIPVINNVQKEATFSVPEQTATNGIVGYTTSVDDGMDNPHGVDKYYSSTVTPAYTHSYLLTSVLSTDYVDVTGNGPSNDDIGSFTRFNYTRKSDDYRWRAPAEDGKAQYNPGFLSDTRDNKASYLIGSREQWVLHSIESKNYVAEFYTSPRQDARGVNSSIFGASAPYFNPVQTQDSAKQFSYQLDSIRLFSKHDRFINKEDAVAIKTIFFEYTNELCKGIPNKVGGDSVGKLTLKKIYMKYGSSYKSMASPYQFTYADLNPGYNEGSKDRWGNYKPGDNTLHPYTQQSSVTDGYAAAWSLKSVTLPSGGIIEINYESDDYAYVQNKTATEMYPIAGVGHTETFRAGNSLSENIKKPYLYLYFARDQARENGQSVETAYGSINSLVYYSVNINLRGSKYEQVRGYARVADIGVTGDHGFIKLKPVTPVGSEPEDASLNPVTYTAINTGRYNLQHIIYPGADPSVSDIANIISGFAGAVGEMMAIGKNPVELLARRGIGKYIDLSKSYIRLSSPGRHKRGGGHRVQSLVFHDSWNAMTGVQEATYGKQYDYTIDNGNNQIISSGVASYEPMIGGEENAMHTPLPFSGRSGSGFPPNDPIDLYQETPIAESLYPPPVVGYRKVTVSSIHADIGRSSQQVDVYRFNTAKEHPVVVQSTPIEVLQDEATFKLTRQANKLAVYQGYTVHLNDMHGKPSSVEHFVRKKEGGEDKLQLVSYQMYRYSKDNNVEVVEPKSGSGGSTNSMVRQTRLVGVDTDITIDTREKKERTVTDNFNINLNVSTLVFVPIPIPFFFKWGGTYENEFRSAVITKVVQRYGLLTEVESFDEGAVTIAKNEAFDAITGQPVITSVNNEYQNKEYTTTYPAYWAYRAMMPTYHNIGYHHVFDTSALVNPGWVSYANGAILPTESLSEALYFNLGDELLMEYDWDNNHHVMTVYVMDFVKYEGMGCCQPLVKPRFTDHSFLAAHGWTIDTEFDNVKVTVLRPGRKNKLLESIQKLTSFSKPIAHYDDGTAIISDYLWYDVIALNTYTYAEPKIQAETVGDSTINPYANGKLGTYRVTDEYTYLQNRKYADTGNALKRAGLFNVKNAFWPLGITYEDCLSSYGSCYGYDNRLIAAYIDTCKTSNARYVPVRKVSKWSPYAVEVENKDAIGNYSTAIYGFDETLPVGIAYNATHGEVLADGFEDYATARVKYSPMVFNYSPFRGFFSDADLAGSSTYSILNLRDDIGAGDFAEVNRGVAHTGNYSFCTPAIGLSLIIALNGPIPTKLQKFRLKNDKKYLLNYWMQPKNVSAHYSPDYTSISLPSGSVRKTKVINGWQQVEYEFTTSPSDTAHTINFPGNMRIDDIRIYPADANMKSFVYQPYRRKLAATLDENNYATFYEYDREGNLVRTKKETEKGIITISESRSAHPKP